MTDESVRKHVFFASILFFLSDLSDGAAARFFGRA
jgi:hypothetical protein